MSLKHLLALKKDSRCLSTQIIFLRLRRNFFGSIKWIECICSGFYQKKTFSFMLRCGNTFCVQVCVCVCVSVCVWVRTWACACVLVCLCTWACVCVCVCVCMHASALSVWSCKYLPSLDQKLFSKHLRDKTITARDDLVRTVWMQPLVRLYCLIVPFSIRS